MRILESQRHKILDQLEKCPSSGDETESPKKRAKYSQEVTTDDNSHINPHDSSATNCNGKVLDHRDATSSASAASFSHNHHRFHHTEMVHRKTVEIRRLSDCNIKHSASVPGGAMTSSINYTKPNRRPSTDSLSRFQPMDSYQTMLHKRRKTSATASSSSSSSTMTLSNDLEQNASKGRGHQLHSNHSFEASGGESEHGSRPGTPLFDERPENSIDPRTPTTAGRSAEPMNLPLPKFAQAFHQQLRQQNQLLPAAHASEKHESNSIATSHLQHSSLKNRSISPAPLTPQIRSRSNSLMPPVSSGSSNSETVLTSPRPPSMVSNSSDSEQELGTIADPNSSPSLEERLKKFTEDYDSWSSNGRSSSSSYYMNSIRHSVPEISVPETPELLKNVIKNSMFDEDTKRLENIGDKYVTQAPSALPTATVTSKNAFGTFGGTQLSLSGTSSPLMSMMNPIVLNSSLATVPVHPEALTAASALSNSLGKLHMPAQQPVTITTMIHQRLGSSGTGSPLNSPNTASPYNSPNPSSASSISSIKGLQYPFPTHPTLISNSSAQTTSTCTISTPPMCTNAVASTATTPTVASSTCPKPKTSCALGKSVSLQEVTPATTSSSATGNNTNSNNFNASCNKSSTNNNNVNNSNAENPPSKLLMKSASLPNCGSSDAVPMEVASLEKIDESKAPTPEPITVKTEEVSKHEVVARKEVETNEKKNHSKDRRKNGENEERDDAKEHAKKESSSFRKEKEAKKSRDQEVEKKADDRKSKNDSKSHKKSKDEHHHHPTDEKKEESVPAERAPSPPRKRRVSFEDVSSVDSASEQTNHVENSKSHSKDSKQHESSKSISKHHHHHNHNHKDKKSSSKEKSHGEDENHSKLRHNDVASSKDSIFDELKRNSKENIIKTSDKVHKSKSKHHHHYHRENSTKDKENQTQVNNFNDTSSSVMTEDVGHSSEDDIIRHHNHNHKKEFSEDHEKRLNHEHHQKSRPESSEEGSAKKKYPRRSINASLSTDDTDDSENGKKPTFFDIPDEAPNISMYDKVKARSCKNLKKQEEEKKIKDKFSALKQSRAKREKKRLNSSDEDSDSDMNDGNSNDMFQMKFRKSQLSGSEEDEKNSENEALRKAKNRSQFSVCDDESSESGITISDGHRKRNKLSSRKMSRTNVIDSSDDEMPTTGDHVEIKQEPSEYQPMVTSDFDELKKQDETHSEKNHKHSSNGSKKRHHDKNKDDKANKKSKKVSKDLHRKSSSLTDSQKRDDKMEDIFGPISDDDIKDVKNNFTAADIKKEPIDEIKDEPSESISKEQQREESKKRKEKRRREREKQRAIKEEDNSVDLDEAGRALEAQLMSDNEQKASEPTTAKEGKTDDVFRFTDGDDEMKREHHDGSKKRKKKKRAKEERKHHHNHHHFDASIKQEIVENSLESSGAFNNNNNNTKIRLDVISSELKPSVPSLMDDLPAKIIPSNTPVIAQVAVPKKEQKPKPEVVIPGFGGVIDETVHQKAVMSIAKELADKKSSKAEVVKTDKAPESVATDSKALKADGDKIEEKSRVVISQEETEDAVAALLGESFGIGIDEDYNDPYDVPIVNNDNDSTGSAMIPPEEDEEMKNAIMSLNPDMDHKPETPQSEHELQIDTDNDEPVEEEEAASQPFDNPPKTPDVDMAQMDKDKPELEPEVSKIAKVDEKKPSAAIATKVEPPKVVVPLPKDEVKVEKSPVKKDLPAAQARPVVSNYQSRFQAPTITIPQDLQPVDRMSPRGSKQPSLVIRTGPHLSPVTPHGSESPRLTIASAPTVVAAVQKVGPIVVSPNPMSQPGSPKIIAIPTKADNKPALIHPPGMQHLPRLNSPAPSTVAPTKPVVSYPQPQPVNKFTTAPPAEKKKVDPKQNNAAASLPKSAVQATAPQHIIPPQQIGRQPQIIYPPTTSGIIQTSFVKAQPEPVKASEMKDKPEQWQMNANSVIQKVDGSKDSKVEKKPAEVESSHDEDDFEDTSPDSSMERDGGSKKVRGAGRQQRGRKAPTITVVQSPPTAAAEDPAGIQTRRGGKAPAVNKRGRGAKTPNAKNNVAPIQVSPQMPMAAPPAGNLMRQQKTSESDVYEFHDDSGEELAKTGDASRPRLIMTIKSTASTTTMSAQPIVTTPVQTQSATTVVQSAPIPAPVIQPQVIQQIVKEPSPEAQLMIPPSPNSQQVPSPAYSDDFAQPNNTRKSRRLQEKDGTRTSVDDTIDDVIRNIGPNMTQQQNNRRATRQTAPPAVPAAAPAVVPTTASQNQQPVLSTLVDAKKQVRVNKKQKDRKASETSESENEKKSDAQLVAPVVAPPLNQNVIQELQSVQQPQPQQPMPPVPILKHTEMTQLIDPVTGELQKMTQREGQYVPVADSRLQMPRHPLPPSTAVPVVHPQFTVELKPDDKKVHAPSAAAIQNVVKVSSPVVLEPPKQNLVAPTPEPTHVIKPVITQNPTYTKPPAVKTTYVLNSPNVAKSLAVSTAPSSPATTVISTQGMMKMNAPMVQHPSTIYNLPNIIPSAGAKYVAQPPQPQKTIVMPPHQSQPTIIHQNPPQSIHQPQIVHQKIPTNGQPSQIVIHSQPHQMMSQQQPSGNLMINIPTSSAGAQGISSPRMQVKQVIQRTVPSQMAPQTISQPAPQTTVVMKSGQPHHVLASNQDPKTPTQTTYIQQGTKLVQGPPDGQPMSYISSGGREIIYVGGSVQKQTIYPNYPPNKYGQQHMQQQAIPSPTQSKPQQIVQQIPNQHQQQQPKLVEKLSSQPSVSVTHIQMPPNPHQQQQKVYFTNSGPVITNVPQPGAPQSGPEAGDRHQQWLPHDKMPQQSQPQPLKSRYAMESYDEAHRAQIQSERAQQQTQGQVKRSYIIEGPGGHPHPLPSQPVHHVPSSVVNQPIIPPQNKKVIGLNQTPQILTGAVASPPLKAHPASQQPIVTGKISSNLAKIGFSKFSIPPGASSSRVAIPPISPKDQLHPRHYPPEGYEDSVMVSSLLSHRLSVASAEVYLISVRKHQSLRILRCNSHYKKFSKRKRNHKNHVLFFLLFLFFLITLCVHSVHFALNITNQQHGDRSAYRSQSPPPAHQTSPLTTVLTFSYYLRMN